ncbi:phosphoserine phosphatase [Rhodoglobus vestalii]|uniref:Phosphoserine phosphatase n=1 Tax=Rhodoglobus vestalii TaxID=193384 RepID=A0A8H2PXQ6_9MICO|nr:HAD-IB family hydrolase [Rhodoglobus vestalii]TQO19524.1 phosphoserine phosphatase [Rhodoglobus vestalii]
MPEVTSPLSSQNAVLAFFDVDNTLMRGASVYYLGKEAWRRGIIGWRDIARFAWHQFRFISVGENHKHMANARERALALIGGHSEKTLFALAEQIYERDILPNLWPETVALTQEHLAKGHEVWLITATPQLVAQVIAARLGLTGALGTRVEAKDGVLTGELDGHVLHGDEKATVAAELAERRGADLAECWAYSDSGNDIPLLSAVGNSVAVNADAKLRNHAKTMGWQILPLNRAGLTEARRRVKRQAKTVRKRGR